MPDKLPSSWIEINVSYERLSVLLKFDLINSSLLKRVYLL